jgi:hypothetical protein
MGEDDAGRAHDDAGTDAARGAEVEHAADEAPWLEERGASSPAARDEQERADEEGS